MASATAFLMDHIPYALALALLGLYAAQLVIANLSRNRKQEKQWAEVESKLETVGASRGPLRWTRRFTSAVFSMPSTATAGYNKFCKALNRPFILPTTWTGRAIVVAPPSALHKLMTRPDKGLAGTGSDITHIIGLIEAIQLPYIISDPDIYMNALHFDVVRRQMTKKHMPFFAAMTADEIEAAFGDIWGTSKEWTTINGWDMCGRIIARTAERMMLGLPHGRDETLLEASRLYANSVLLGGAVMNCFPPFLRGVAGPLIALRAKYYQKRCVRILVPIIEERMAIYRGEKKVKEVPEDFIQWLIATCDKDGPHQMFADRIANRLIALMTPLIFAVCYVFAHTVLDIYGSPDREEFIQGLEDEAKRVSSLHNGLATAEAVDELYRFDSAIRESMRKSDVSVTSLHRDVTSGEMDLGNGIIIGEGVRVGFPTQNIHMDPDNYHEPGRYDAFRFSRPFEGIDEASRKTDEAPERELITTPTQSFLPLGYGRHACPGRWFAANTMKQALAFIVMNYDLELIGKPIKRQSLLNTMVPPVDAQIRIRRKS